MFKELIPLIIAFSILFILAVIATIITNIDIYAELEKKIINDNTHINIDCVPIWTWNADENLGEFTDICK